jgi:hypothetical protein
MVMNSISLLVVSGIVSVVKLTIELKGMISVISSVTRLLSIRESVNVLVRKSYSVVNLVPVMLTEIVSVIVDISISVLLVE